MAKMLLKASSIINFVVAGLSFFLIFAMFGLVELLGRIGFPIFQVILGMIASYAVIIFIAGMVFFNYSKLDDETLSTKGPIVLIWSIVLVPLNFIAALLSMIAFAKMDQPKKEAVAKKRIDAETKKMVLLLNLGTILIGIAGIMFATSSWESMGDIVKVGGLFFFTVIFLGISILSDKKFNLKNSSIAYFILANLFLVFTVLSAGYFEVFGGWFSLYGEGSKLFIMTIFLIIAVLSLYSLNKYKAQPIIYLFGASIMGAIISLMMHFSVTIEIVKVVIGAILLIAIVVNKIIYNSNKFAYKMLGILLAVFTLIQFTTLDYEQNTLLNVISASLLILSLYAILAFSKNQVYDILTPVITILLATSFIVFYENELNLEFLTVAWIAFGVGLAVCLFSYLNIGSNSFKVASLCVSFIPIADWWFAGIGQKEYVYTLVVAGVLLILNIVTMVSKKEGIIHKIEGYLQPAKIILLIISATVFIEDKLDLDSSIWLVITSLAFIGMAFINKNRTLKNIYLIGSIVAIIVHGLFEFNNESITLGVLSIISVMAIFAVVLWTRPAYSYIAKRLAFLLMMLVSFENILIVTANHDMLISGVLITLILACLTACLFVNDRFIFGTSLLFLIYSYFILTNHLLDLDKDLEMIFNIIPMILGIFIITRILLGKASNNFKNIFEIITIAFVFAPYMFGANSFMITLAIGISAFIFIIIGLGKQRIYSLFYTGIIILILNILTGFKDFWESMPLWGYTLLAGIILIGIVTYKEYKRNKIKAERVEDIEEEAKAENKSISTIKASMVCIVVIALFVIVISYEKVDNNISDTKGVTHNYSILDF